ncbi:MAG TPA: hypothetical protein VMX74_00925 [Pirellulales bacterium]|nr:hypothetical protein [Pirellulales bacterium]
MKASQSSEASPAETASNVAHLVPSDQPGSAHDIANRLLSAYKADGGNVHMAGCSLTDVPIIRISPFSDGPAAFRIFDPAAPLGRELDDQQYDQLGMDQLVPASCPPTVSPRELEGLLDRARQAAADGEHESNEPFPIVWCKYAHGKIQFTLGDAVASVTFSDWARTLQPPPYRCPASGKDTYTVSATSDGRVVSADQIAVCEQTGQRLPRGELIRCAVTGKLVRQDLTDRCPVSGQTVVTGQLVACPTCRESVSPQAIIGRKCTGCRGLSSVSREDPRIIRILSQCPRLSGWQWLRLAETETAFIVVGSGVVQRRLLVLDKDSLAIRYAARGRRASRKWTDVVSTEAEGFW